LLGRIGEYRRHVLEPNEEAASIDGADLDSVPSEALIKELLAQGDIRSQVVTRKIRFEASGTKQRLGDEVRFDPFPKAGKLCGNLREGVFRQPNALLHSLARVDFYVGLGEQKKVKAETAALAAGAAVMASKRSVVRGWWW